MADTDQVVVLAHRRRTSLHTLARFAQCLSLAWFVSVAAAQSPWETTGETLPPVVVDEVKRETQSYQPIPLDQLRSPQPPAPPLRAEPIPSTPTMTLAKAWEAAVVADAELQATDADWQSAQQQIESAVAEYRPSVRVNAGYEVRNDELSYRIMPPIAPVPIGQPFMQREFFDFGASVRVPLYTGGKIAHGVDAAAHQANAASASRDTRRLDLKFKVTSEYVAVLRAQDELSVAQTYLQNLVSHRRDVEALFEQGRAPKNDLLSAKVAVADARHSVIVAQHQLDAARATFNRRLGQTLDAEIKLTPLRYRPQKVNLEEATAQAFATRPELQRLSAQVASIRHRAAVARAAVSPQVYAEGAYGFRENQFQDPQGIVSARVGVDWNVLDFGRSAHQASALDLTAQATQRRWEHLASIVRLQVRRAWLHVEETRHRVEVAEQALEQADENARVTRSQYRAGRATNTDVLGAELLRMRTYQNYNGALYDAIVAQAWMERVCGQTAE